jgi:fused signal recognition particle receptor
MFNFIKNSLKKIYHAVTGKLAGLFGKKTVDAETLKELELILLQADTGVPTTRTIINQIREQQKQGLIEHGSALKDALEVSLLDILTHRKAPQETPITLLVGINGSGKTTFAAKLAQHAVKQGHKVLLVAADTFRAAAPEQLNSWAERTGADIITGKPGQDPASVVFAGCTTFKQGGYDRLIIDTAGRLQTKVNLMHELEKIKRSIHKQLPDIAITTLVTIDSMLGQNSFEQAKLFHESTDLSGIVLTKMDGTGKGGIVFAIAHQLEIPVAYISYGEQPEDFKPFDAADYVRNLLAM